MYGAEAGLHWNPLKGLVVSGGYQLLYAKDQTGDRFHQKWKQ